MLLFALLVISFIFNLIHLTKILNNIHQLEETKNRIDALQKELSTRKLKNSYEVEELLHDLTAGKALIEIKRVAPSSFFLRSPRDSE